MSVNIDTFTDDLVDNIMGDRDFTDFGNDSNSGQSDGNDGNDNPSGGAINTSQVFNDSNELIGFQCARVLENNPNLVDIPLLFYIDMKFPKGSEAVAKKRVQTELLMAIARDFRITTGKACTDPPPNGISWLVAIKSDTDQLEQDETFPKCRQLEFIEATEDCFVYSFELTGNVLTGKTMPDVEAVVESLFVNQVEKTLGSDFGVKFLGIPKYEDGADDKTINIPPSNLEDIEQGNNPINRQTITIVGGFLVAAFCLATAGILLVLYRRRKITQLKEQQELERSPKQHFSHDTEDEDYDHEVPDQHLHALDLGNSFNQQVLGAHTPTNASRTHNNGANRGPAKYLTNVNPNQGPYSHFYGQQAAGAHRRNHSNQSDLMSQSTVDSWAQTNATIGSLELQLEPITGEI
ncbi:unnamed protein product [Cylindrotheca closterium]|uniref:Uncharacterized protein n=1 Tax=Cylindrotheca closterium TaxID=2856 RepID=A0AAD2D0Z8_9STRA|nr:unnamed protein product [Cylindrotheca closterium]